MCECGQNEIQFYIIEKQKHFCERCAVNEIYKNESYEKVVEKVWNKVKNIMKFRQRVCQMMHQRHSQEKGGAANKETPQPELTVSDKEMNIERLNLFYDLL